MSMIKKINQYIKNPYLFIPALGSRGYLSWLPDKMYLSLCFRAKLGHRIEWNNLKTFNEKCQWLKLYDRKSIYTTLVDKYEVKEYVANKIGRQYIIPTLGVWNRFEDIDYESLPEQFVLKCTHDSGSIVICKDKNSFDKQCARQKINKHLKRNLYEYGREWPYKSVPRRIIAEEYMVDESGTELKDYKVFCFNGKPEYVEVDFNRFIEHKLNPYDFDWNPLHFCDKSKNDYSADIKKPARLDDMYQIAAELSREMKFLRVDFYSIYDKIYVGELTLYPGSGFIQFDPPEIDIELGKLLRLEEESL